MYDQFKKGPTVDTVPLDIYFCVQKLESTGNPIVTKPKPKVEPPKDVPKADVPPPTPPAPSQDTPAPDQSKTSTEQQSEKEKAEAMDVD